MIRGMKAFAGNQIRYNAFFSAEGLQMSTIPSLAIGFIGAGQMATALARGWALAGLLNVNHSRGSDPLREARQKFTASTGIPSVESNLEVVSDCKIVILAVKPQILKQVLSEIRSRVTPEHCIISIAAGITLKQLSDGLEANYRLVRVMPNTPSIVNASATGFALSTTATNEDLSLVQKLFNVIGNAYPVSEKLLDAVTGLSGSGPAYVYVLIEALADGGVRMGLPRDVALALASQTVLGAAKMVQESGLHPGALKDAVTSPGGTTIAGLHALERAGFRGAVMDAVEAATLRSIELGKG
jgi:pyrroline-5-carboxylate reductase